MSQLRTLRTQIGTLAGHAHPVLAVAYSPYLKLLVSMDAGDIKLWRRPFNGEGAYAPVGEAHGGLPAATPSRGYSALSLHPHQRKLFVGTTAGRLYVFSIDEGGCLSLRNHVQINGSAIQSMQWLEITEILVTGHADGSIGVYDPASNKVWSRPATRKPIQRIFMDEGTETLCVVDRTAVLKMFKLSLANASRTRQVREDQEERQGLAVTTGAGRPRAAAAGSAAKRADGGSSSPRASGTALSATLQANLSTTSLAASVASAPVATQALSEEDRKFYCPKPLDVLGAAAGGRKLTLAHSRYLRCACVDTENGLIFAGGQDKLLSAWNIQGLATGQPTHLIYCVREHSKPITGVTWEWHRQILFSCDEEGSVFAWDANRQCVINSWTAHTGACNGLLLDPEQGILITYGADKLVKLWRVWVPVDA